MLRIGEIVSEEYLSIMHEFNSKGDTYRYTLAKYRGSSRADLETHLDAIRDVVRKLQDLELQHSRSIWTSIADYLYRIEPVSRSRPTIKTPMQVLLVFARRVESRLSQILSKGELLMWEFQHQVDLGHLAKEESAVNIWRIRERLMSIQTHWTNWVPIYRDRYTKDIRRMEAALQRLSIHDGWPDNPRLGIEDSMNHFQHAAKLFHLIIVKLLHSKPEIDVLASLEALEVSLAMFENYFENYESSEPGDFEE